jgi:hypothetical protein
MNTGKIFEEGNVYTMRFIANADLKIGFICTKVTAKTVTLESIESSEVVNKRIKTYNGIEYISFDGCNVYADRIEA